MFQNNQDILNIVKKQEENHFKMAAELGAMGSTLANIEKILSKTNNTYTSEDIVLQTYDKPFKAEGYLYNSLIIGDSAANDNAKLIVTLGGVSYTIPLVAGENAVNIPDDANIRVTTTSNNPVTAILSRYNTPGNNDTNVSINSPVKITDGTNIPGVYTMGDGGNQGNSLATNAYLGVFNGTSWDRVRSAYALAGVGTAYKGILATQNVMYNGSTADMQYNNTQGTLLASGTRTAGVQSPTQTNYNARGVIVYLNVSAASGTGGLQVKIDSSDPVSGQWVQFNATPPAVTATGIYTYLLYPGASATGLTQTTSGALPRSWFVNITAGDATSYTYSLGYQLIL